MTRYTNMADLLRNISPDVTVLDDAALLALDNAGSLGGATMPAPTEHDEQAALFTWAATNEAAHPELACMFAIPNGGHRHPAVAAMLKAEGVRAGVPDIFIAAPRGRWAGLFLELKRADHSNGPTEAQRMWIERLREQGYSTAICYGAAEAQQCIMAYLSLEARND